VTPNTGSAIDEWLIIRSSLVRGGP
jgi:hypothetical protein